MQTNEQRSLRRRIVIVTGELSGEMHAANLVRALATLSSLQFSGMGSTALADAGAEIIYDYRDISLVGLSEIIKKARHIRRAYVALKNHLTETSPDLVILVDFGLFNLRLVARLAKRLSIPTVYFIPPQVWASRKRRINQIKASVDLVLSILPFEEALYKKHGINFAYVGHPYVRSVKPVYSKQDFSSLIGLHRDGPVITIMPGSRQREVEKHMPVLMDVANHLDRELGSYTLLLPVAGSLSTEYFAPFFGKRDNIILTHGLAHDCLKYSDAAIIASGSATLEAAVLGVPSVVIYKMSYVEYLLARLIVQVPYISLPNLIAGKQVFPEFIQSLDPDRIANAVASMLKDSSAGSRADLELIRDRLGTSGPDPYRKAGDEILRFLEYTHGPLPQTS